ncbi:unnamed protein product [Protopolystoma xenopodis]|uniref:Uncharacterized protein n=1 Tax=Protopolystoma xenopodis TaxID=117903 RepID=A0A3S5CSH5_9PLAT|nr:unnamed protein product [Protopolystoma xenopodis]
MMMPWTVVTGGPIKCGLITRSWESHGWSAACSSPHTSRARRSIDQPGRGVDGKEISASFTALGKPVVSPTPNGPGVEAVADQNWLHNQPLTRNRRRHDGNLCDFSFTIRLFKLSIKHICLICTSHFVQGDKGTGN